MAFVVKTRDTVGRGEQALARPLQDSCKGHAAPCKYPRKVQVLDAAYLEGYETIPAKTQRKRLKELE